MVSNRPNGTSAFIGSTMPGPLFMVASRSRKSCTRSGLTGAVTMKCPWVINRQPGRDRSGLEFEREVDQARLVPVDLAEIDVRRDQADLVADPLRHHRGLGVVEDDALLVVEPARRLVDLGDDRVDTEWQDAVAQGAGLGVEHLALPGEDVDQLGDVVAEFVAGRDDRGAVGLSVRDRAGFVRAEQGIQLGLRLGQQLLNDLAHDITPANGAAPATRTAAPLEKERKRDAEPLLAQ